MGEKNGFVYVLFMVGAFFMPLFIDLWVASVTSDQFMKITTEFHQVVQAEGGKTEKVDNIIKGLKETHDYHISIPDAGGGVEEVGTRLEIHYAHSYPGAFGVEHNFKTSNAVIVDRRVTQ